jgi:hypothetical protein
MYRLFSLALAAAALAAPPQIAHADVVWTFWETSCSFPCPALEITFPYALATLTLPSDSSSGSVTWGGFPFETYPTGAIISGDPFSLAFADGITITQDSTNARRNEDLREFTLQWTETPGLLSANIFFLTESDEIIINDSGRDFVGSDGILGGCFFALCQMTGSWAVPEPRSAVLLLTGLLVTSAGWLAYRARG